MKQIKFQLKNKLKVLLIQSQKSPVVSVQMWVKTGSADEKKSEEDSYFNIDLNFREEQILQMIIDGATSKDIADKMMLSKKTIDYYRSNLLRKFNIKTQIELAKCGIKHFEQKKEKPV